MTETMMGDSFRTLLRIGTLIEKAKGYLNLKSKLHFSARGLKKETRAG